MRFRPRAGGMIGGDEENALVRSGIENPVFARMKTDGRCPDAAAGLDLFVNADAAGFSAHGQ